MQKKGIIFVGIATLIFIFAFYAQIVFMKNDVKIYASQSESTLSDHGTRDEYEVIPLEVNRDSNIYVSYRGKAEGGNLIFRLVDKENNDLIHETGEYIDILKEKIYLEEGKYRFIISVEHTNSIWHKYNMIYRREDVYFSKAR